MLPARRRLRVYIGAIQSMLLANPVQVGAGRRLLMIPYKNTVQALQGTVAGDVNVVTYAAGGAATFVKTGKLRALAYTGDVRPPFFPDVPTFSEHGMKLGFRT